MNCTGVCVLLSASFLQPPLDMPAPDAPPQEEQAPQPQDVSRPLQTGSMSHSYRDQWRLGRAGCPHFIAPWADYTYGPKYSGYYVGGGAPFYAPVPDRLHGQPRYPHEGTWGMDYNPWYSRVRLQWYHGWRHQDGEGQYEPDHCNNPLDPLFLR